MVRQLDESEGPLLRAIRLRALQDSPQAFGESLAGALECADAEWTSLTQSTHVVEIAGQPVGMAYTFTDRTDAQVARVGGMWVAPELRRRGIALALLASARSWAVSRGHRLARLWVVPASPAEALYVRAGYARNGKEMPFSSTDSRLLVEMELALL